MHWWRLMLKEEWGCRHWRRCEEVRREQMPALKRSEERGAHLNPLCKREDWKTPAEGSNVATGARWEGTPEEPACCDSLWGEARQVGLDVQPQGG